ncbi:MAG: hypothetical protein VE97_C0004G0006 [candidate division Kazan bacterium GW2011_GWB1_45_10]|uniref:Uncharacterized protein n=1 Tax=candidate division Kazan bacterium GW2011_GWB1_45_10 TaxID=1620411 RepID=A0A0G1N277_UNCK3|nr:MAG: hypothetical protein VE97_C0004G0006 [candidate division Kazan bacterium GW2011_GWB1_45_10]
MAAIFLTTNVLIDADLIGRPQETTSSPRANAQAAAPTTFYFKGDYTISPTRTANNYFGVAGPTVENSSDTSGMVVGGQGTALGMIPIAGPIDPGTASYSIVSPAFTTTPDVDMAWFRTFIMPLASGTNFVAPGAGASTFEVGVSASESNGALNGFVRAFIYVYDSGTNSNVKTLAGPTSHGTEIGTGGSANSGRIWTVANAMTGGNYTSGNTDYLAVEIWVDASTRTAATRFATLNWGGNVAVVDGTNNTTPASYVTVGITAVDTFDPLWLRETTTSYEPTPNAHQTGDTFQAGTWEGRRSSTTAGSSAETKTQAVTVTGNPLYYQMNTWTSPPLTAQTIPAATWVLHMHGNETAATDNAQYRYMIYVWKNDDSGSRGTIAAVANSGTEWGIATSDNQVEVLITGSSVASSLGDRLVVEVELVSLAASTAGNVLHRFGGSNSPGISNYDSAILPPMNYASTPTPLAYANQLYNQTHWRFDEDNDDNTSNDTHAAWTDKDGATTEDDTTVAFLTATNFRLRFQIRNQGDENPDTLSPKVYYRVNSPPGSWTEITTGSSNVTIVTSANVADALATTRQLTDDSASGFTFTAGSMEENSSPAGDTTMLPANFTEYEWSLQSATVATYDFKVTDNGTDFDFYPTTYPKVVFSTAASLGVTAPTDVTLTTGNPGVTTETTWGAGELVAVTYGSAAWSLTVIMTVTLNDGGGGHTIPDANVKLRTDGIPAGGDGTGDTYTLWSGVITSTNETTSGTYSLDTTRAVGTRSSGANGSVTNIRPTIQVVMPPSQIPADYDGTMQFTVA